MWSRVNFFGSMNWIGMGALYRNLEPKVKSSAQTYPGGGKLGAVAR